MSTNNTTSVNTNSNTIDNGITNWRKECQRREREQEERAKEFLANLTPEETRTIQDITEYRRAHKLDYKVHDRLKCEVFIQALKDSCNVNNETINTIRKNWCEYFFQIRDSKPVWDGGEVVVNPKGWFINVNQVNRNAPINSTTFLGVSVYDFKERTHYEDVLEEAGEKSLSCALLHCCLYDDVINLQGVLDLQVQNLLHKTQTQLTQMMAEIDDILNSNLSDVFKIEKVRNVYIDISKFNPCSTEMMWVFGSIGFNFNGYDEALNVVHQMNAIHELEHPGEKNADWLAEGVLATPPLQYLKAYAEDQLRIHLTNYRTYADLLATHDEFRDKQNELDKATEDKWVEMYRTKLNDCKTNNKHYGDWLYPQDRDDLFNDWVEKVRVKFWEQAFSYREDNINAI